MIQNNKKKGPVQDYFEATLENGSLVMKPFCACGNALDEDYFCEKCNRRCFCNRIRCDNEKTLELVRSYIIKSPKFSGFKATLLTQAERTNDEDPQP